MKHLKVFENFEETGHLPVEHQEHSEVDNYMFFANLENIIKMAQEILAMDKNQIDEMLTNET